MPGSPGNRNLGPLYRRHRSELLAYLTHRVNCCENANDLLQDAFIRLMNSEVAKIGNARAFLYRIANNLSIDHARRNRARGINDDHELQTQTGDPQNSAIAGNKPSIRLTHRARLHGSPVLDLGYPATVVAPVTKSTPKVTDFQGKPSPSFAPPPHVC